MLWQREAPPALVPGLLGGLADETFHLRAHVRAGPGKVHPAAQIHPGNLTGWPQRERCRWLHCPFCDSLQHHGPMLADARRSYPNRNWYQRSAAMHRTQKCGAGSYKSWHLLPTKCLHHEAPPCEKVNDERACWRGRSQGACKEAWHQRQRQL